MRRWWFPVRPAPTRDSRGAQTRFGALLYCEVDPAPAGFSSNETLALDFWRAGHQPAPLGESDEMLLRKFAPA